MKYVNKTKAGGTVYVEEEKNSMQDGREKEMECNSPQVHDWMFCSIGETLCCVLGAVGWGGLRTRKITVQPVTE